MLLTWVPLEAPWRIAQTHRPRSGAGLREDMQALSKAGADLLVSCLTDDDVLRFELQDEEAEAEAAGLEFLRYPIVDHSLPAALEPTLAFSDGLADALEAGRGVVVHCYAGIGRSGLVLVTTLVRLGLPLTQAAQAASRARGLVVPETRAQRQWLSQVTPRQR